MADIAIAQGAVQQVQPAPQAAVPTVDAGSASTSNRPDQVVNVPPQVNADGNGQSGQNTAREDIVIPPRADAEQESANIVLNRESEEQNVVVRLRYSVSDEQVYLEIVDVDTNDTIARVPRQSVLPSPNGEVPLTTQPRGTTDTTLESIPTSSQIGQQPVSDVNNAVLEQFFERQ